MADDEERESRFAHLLKPIRDLAENWNIDLAAELEEYLDEVEHLQVTLDDGRTMVNFAEAALLIQGSAIVYSKKVEYLYTLIFQVLEHVSRNGTKRTRQSSTKEDGTDADLMFDDEDGYLALDDALMPAGNIDMNPNRAVPSASPDQLAIKFTSPSNHLDSAGAMAASTPLSAMGAFQSHASAHGHGLSLATCTMHKSGALLLDENKRALMELASDALNGSTISNILPRNETSRTADAHSPGSVSTVPYDAGGDGGDGGGDYDDGFNMADIGGGGPEPSPIAATHKQAMTPATNSRVSFGTAVSPSDPWEQLDPHDAGPFRSRPFRKGVTAKRPVLPSKSANPHMGRLGVQLPSQPIDIHVSMTAAAPFFTEFTQYFKVQRQRKAAERLAERQARSSKRQEQVAGLDDDESDDDDFGGGAGDDHSVGGPMPDFGGAPDVMDFDGGGDDFGGGWEPAGDVPAAAAQPSAAAPAAGTAMSYEDFCREQIAAFAQSAKEFSEDTSISLRLQDWKSRIEPLMAEQDARPKFDIHECGDAIMDNVETAVQTHHDGSTQVDFHEVVSSCDEYQVCRMFLASLQLANNGNVEIIPGSTDGFELRLLTREKAVDFDTYLAPSLQSSAKRNGTHDAGVVESKSQDLASFADGENASVAPRKKATAKRGVSGATKQAGRASGRRPLSNVVAIAAEQ